MKTPRLLMLLALTASVGTASLGQAADAITVDITHIVHPADSKPHKVCRFAVTNFSGNSAESRVGNGRYTITQTLNRDHSITVKIVYSMALADATTVKVIAKPSLTVKEGVNASIQQGEDEFQVFTRLER